ncbi:MAG: hypothetical protein AAF770_01075 [Bacteroidota bacterium]
MNFIALTSYLVANGNHPMTLSEMNKREWSKKENLAVTEKTQQGLLDIEERLFESPKYVDQLLADHQKAIQGSPVVKKIERKIKIKVHDLDCLSFIKGLKKSKKNKSKRLRVI